ncbi:DNA polymerase III subunit delta [Cellulosilyticum sp. ST5]|uniref:DNA polymerase III subunit delta n=1 Tax=Cellulosilyticum sp. ST5 TaxID=3055805 RepID=UPI0039776586
MMQGCYLLLGEDSWSKGQYIEKVKKEVLASGNEMMNFYEAQDKEVIVSQVQDAVDTLPFFAEQKLILLKETGLFKTGKKEETEKFETLVAHIPDYVVLLIDEKEVDKRNKLYKTMKAKAQIVEFHFPGEEAVYQFLKNACKEKRLSSDEMTLRYFIQKMPEDMAYLLGEWEKLISYVQDGVITKEAINEICIFSLETRVFEMVKKIVNHEGNEALEIYSRMIQSKESPIGILVLIARQFRMMYQVKYLLANRSPLKEISAETKLPFFVVKEMSEQVQHYQFKQLEDILEACLNTDEAIKTGKMESSKCVEMLIMNCLNG